MVCASEFAVSTLVKGTGSVLNHLSCYHSLVKRGPMTVGANPGVQDSDYDSYELCVTKDDLCTSGPRILPAARFHRT